MAKAMEEAGVSAIAIHGRCKSDMYSGKVNLDWIKKVKESVSIPVIGNGDVKSLDDYNRMIKETNCDGVMIGRGLLGNPWLIKECVLNKKIDVSLDDKIDMALKHLNYLLEFKSEKIAILEMRTHICYYLKGISNTYKQKIFKVTTKEEFIKVIEEVRNEYCI